MSITSLSRARRGLTAIIAGGALAAGVLALGAPAQAAAPSNDAFAHATVISGTSVTVTGTNVDATTETGEPLNMGYSWTAGATVWYRWTAPVTADFAVSTAGSNFDTELGVYTGSSVGALTRVASNDEDLTSDDTSGTGFAATAGKTYYIQVGGYDTGTAATGDIKLALGQAAAAGTMTYASTDSASDVPLAGCLGFFTDPTDPQGSLVSSGCGIGSAPGAASAYSLGLVPAGSYYVVAIDQPSPNSGTNEPTYYPGVADATQATKVTVPAGGCTLTGLNVNFNTGKFTAPSGKSCPLSPACLNAKSALGAATTALAADKSALAKDDSAVKKLKKKFKKAKKHHKPAKKVHKLHKKLKKAKKKAKSASAKVGAASHSVTSAQASIAASC